MLMSESRLRQQASVRFQRRIVLIVCTLPRSTCQCSVSALPVCVTELPPKMPLVLLSIARGATPLAAVDVCEAVPPRAIFVNPTGTACDLSAKRATAVLRGLRNVTDLNFEFQLALTNRAIADVETVFTMTGDAYAFASSTLIKQIAAGGDIDRLHRMLPPLVIEMMKQKKQDHGGKLPWLHVDHFTE